VPPFVDGLRYSCCGQRIDEQQWLDNAIKDLKLTEVCCNDPELKAVLSYTIKRYNKIGGWDVAIMPCPSTSSIECAGLNNPFCPGVTIDPSVMSLPIHQGALVLVHESLHDYFPYFGHSHVTPIMNRLEAL
jgi:hypothetical protein